MHYARRLLALDYMALGGDHHPPALSHFFPLMSCTHPNRAFPTGWLTDNGKPEYFFDTHLSEMIPALQVEKRFKHPQNHNLVDYIEIPCRKCYECKRSTSYKWSFRVQCEAQDWHPDLVWFFTLTYDQEHLPADNVPLKSDLSDFMRSLRDWLGHDVRIRFFGCGEKGGKKGRAHIHVVLFGFPGKRLSKYRWSDKLWIFPKIEEIWRKGFCPGEAVIDAAGVGAYVAKYQLKDFGRDGCWISTSLKPGIGVRYIEDNFGPFGEIILGNGKGALIRGVAPKCIRDRLDIPADPEVQARMIVDCFNKMHAAGYKVSQVDVYKFIERFRETYEYAHKKKEAYSRLKQL